MCRCDVGAVTTRHSPGGGGLERQGLGRAPAPSDCEHPRRFAMPVPGWRASVVGNGHERGCDSLTLCFRVTGHVFLR